MGWVSLTFFVFAAAAIWLLWALDATKDPNGAVLLIIAAACVVISAVFGAIALFT